MRYIVLSTDGRPSLFEAPDAIAERLSQYADEFLDSVHHHDSSFWAGVTDAPGREYKRLSYSVEDFVAWLNQKRASQFHSVREAAFLAREDREIILETARKERYLPHEQQQYPWINFPSC